MLSGHQGSHGGEVQDWQEQVVLHQAAILKICSTRDLSGSASVITAPQITHQNLCPSAAQPRIQHRTPLHVLVKDTVVSISVSAPNKRPIVNAWITFPVKFVWFHTPIKIRHRLRLCTKSVNYRKCCTRPLNVASDKLNIRSTFLIANDGWGNDSGQNDHQRYRSGLLIAQ